MGRQRVATDRSPKRRIRAWVARYLPAELAGLVTALIAAAATYRITGSGVSAALSATLGENIGYYGVIGLGDLLRHYRALGGVPAGAGGALRAVGRTARDLGVEFGPAEAVDS